MAQVSSSAKVSSAGETIETQRKLQDSVFFNPKVLNETI
jgi:hypothetical protein